jgi:YgiT-type zinc finger domain-containing protein
MNKQKCPVCSAEMAEGKHTLRETVAGRSFERVVPALVCPSCGELAFSSVDLGAFEMQVAEALASGPPSPEAADYIRGALGLAPGWQGYDKATMQSWRAGSPVAPAAWAALVAAVRAAEEAPRATGTGG